MDEAEKELGCDSQESCSAFCSQTENRSKCEKISQKHNPENDNKSSKKQSSQAQNTTPCTGDAECKNYCSSHPDECPGFPATSLSPLNKSADQTGEFLGPAGCKTNGECQAYCQKHPSECPNFPNAQVTPKISPVQKNPDRNISPKSGGDQKPPNTSAPESDSGMNSGKNKFK